MTETALSDREWAVWRALTLIASAHSYEKIQNLEHAQEAGIVVGQFQRLRMGSNEG